MPRPNARPKADQDTEEKVGGPVFWKITGAGASFQAGSAAVDSATTVVRSCITQCPLSGVKWTYFKAWQRVR